MTRPPRPAPLDPRRREDEEDPSRVEPGETMPSAGSTATSGKGLSETPAPNQEHDLKTWPDYYKHLVDGSKTFEHRRNDRNFRVGDTLLLREWEPTFGTYTGRAMRKVVTYLHHVSRDFVVLALGEPPSTNAVDPVPASSLDGPRANKETDLAVAVARLAALEQENQQLEKQNHKWLIDYGMFAKSKAALDEEVRRLQTEHRALTQEWDEAFGLVQKELGIDYVGDDPDDLLHHLKGLLAERQKTIAELGQVGEGWFVKGHQFLNEAVMNFVMEYEATRQRAIKAEATLARVQTAAQHLREDLEAEIEKSLRWVEKDAVVIDWAKVKPEGLGGYEPVVTHSTAMHALLFVRKVLRDRVLLGVQEPQHTPDCERVQAGPDGRCTCGLAARLAAAQEPPSEKEK